MKDRLRKLLTDLHTLETTGKLSVSRPLSDREVVEIGYHRLMLQSVIAAIIVILGDSE